MGCPISKKSEHWDVKSQKMKETQIRETNSKFSTVVRHGGDLGPRPRRFSPSFFFSTGDVSLRTGPPPSSRVASISASSSCHVNYT